MVSVAAIERNDDSPAPYCGDDERWLAVTVRDQAADGHFYYSVRTTGIYCRPSCPSRTARREHVAFHRTLKEAAAAARACKRCLPNDSSLHERRAALIAAACRRIEGADALPSLAALAHEAGLSRFHFARMFRAFTGVTPKAYVDAERVKRFRTGLLAQTNVTSAIYEAGFDSSATAYARSNDALGMTPGSFRAGGSGATLHFAAGRCSLGEIVVAASDRGVCAILLGDDPEVLVRDLQDRFPRAVFIGGDARFEQWVAKVVGLIEAPHVGTDLPLDIRGTAFQIRVWDALRRIAPQTTASYAQVAAVIGAPGAVRAVASACAANPLAVAIPCHRVVGRDGRLCGYRWGIERKRKLLEREAAS